MEVPINWRDSHYISKNRTILTEEQLQIPGIRVFATYKIQNAILPLLPHYHENAFEFTYLVKGNMTFHTDNRDYSISGGDVFVSFPNEVHSTNHMPISLNHQYWLQVDVSDPDHFLFLNRSMAQKLIADLKSIPRHVIATDRQEIRSVLEQAFALTQKEGSQLFIASYLSVFLQLVIQFSRESRYHMTPDIQSAITYIHAHLKEELSLDTIAAVCGLSTSQFKQKFRQVVGVAPRAYINQKKIEYSKTLLSQGRSITETAMELGFADSSYFSTVFKKYTMETPRAYAAAHKELQP